MTVVTVNVSCGWRRVLIIQSLHRRVEILTLDYLVSLWYWCSIHGFGMLKAISNDLSEHVCRWARRYEREGGMPIASLGCISAFFGI